MWFDNHRNPKMTHVSMNCKSIHIMCQKNKYHHRSLDGSQQNTWTIRWLERLFVQVHSSIHIRSCWLMNEVERSTLPEVTKRPRLAFSSVSLTRQFGWSTLLPRTRKGTVANCSIASRDFCTSSVTGIMNGYNGKSTSNSAFDSANRSGSAASTRKTMPDTSGK